MAKTSAERSREWRERQKVAQPKKTRKAKATAADDRKEAARAAYAALKKDKAAYEAMLIKARERARKWHAKVRAERAKAKRGAR